MKPILLLVAVHTLVVGHAFAGPEQFLYKKGPGPYEVTAIRLDWKDEKRDREVPVKIYAPKADRGRWPVIVFSHGLGGSRDGYEYLGKHWASHGYLCLHLQHKGSDDAVWKASKQPLADMRKAVQNPANAANRPADVRFALDQVALLNRDDLAFKGRMDLERIGMAGHSFGGWTTQAVVGEVFVTPGGKEVTQTEPRIKAAVIMSPSPARGKAYQEKAFGRIKVPCLHLTGTKDDGVGITQTKPGDRRLPFQHITKADQYLVIFQGGDHMVFANARGKPGAGKLGDGTKDPRFLDLIRMTTTAFWDTYLKDDATARAWLQGAGVRQALGEDGAFEIKKGQTR